MESIIDRVFNIISTNNILGLRTLLEDGLDPNIRNHPIYIRGERAEETALMYATTYGHIDIVRLLLEYNADPNITDSDGETALTMAVPLHRFDNEGIVKTLLEYNADPNLQNVNGNTPLIKATIFNQIYIVHLLLDNGADPFMKNIRGDTALDLAERYFAMGDVDREVIDLLKSRMATIRLQSRHRGIKTRHKLRTSMARRRSALNQVADEYGLNEEIIHMLNSRMTRPTRLDVIDETPRDILLQEQRENQSIADYLDDLDQYGSGFSKRSGLSNRKKKTRKRLYK